MTQAFAGVRIVDFSSGIPGPMATMLLADFGADVVKVEPPAGDRLRTHPGYLCWNRNKRRLTIDLATYEGLRAAHRLIATADVAIFDHAPGELERLGLDGATLGLRYPALLHVWLPSYAAQGRWAGLPPDDLLLHAVTGVAHLQLSFEDQPVALVTPQVAYAHAAIAANGIAAALWERRQSGRGQAITISGLNAVAAIEGGAAITTENGVMRTGRTSRGGMPHYRLYRCADDRWFFLGCLTAPFFLRALDALGLGDVMTMEGVDGEFANLMQQPMNGQAQAILEAKFAERLRQDWLDILHAAGVPRGPAGIREEWFREETVAANEMRVLLEHPVHGCVEMPGLPLKLSDTPGEIRGFLADTTLEEVFARRPSPPAPLPGGEGGASLDLPASLPASGRPLQGVRVLDLGAFIAGTFAPTVLANYGADVIKVEPIDGDPFRPYGLLFYGHNLGKRSVALDLKQADGRAAFEALVRGADVVLDNFRLGVRERLGIDYATLSAINPGIITCSVTGYGPEGPLAADPGFDPLLQARSGMMMAQGGNEEPVFHQIAVNDTATAMIAAFGIQVALHARERTGRGQEVVTCLANQTILFQSGELTHYEGRPPAPLGGVDYIGPSALRRYYQCAEGWLALACREPRHFHSLAAALGHPEWAARTIAERALDEPNDGALAASIAQALAGMPVDEAVDRLAARGVPAARALLGSELFGDPWFRQNGFFQEIDDPQWGRMTTVRSYADWSRSTGGFPYRAPQMGEQGAEVLRESGLDDGRIATLVERGVLRLPG